MIIKFNLTGTIDMNGNNTLDRSIKFTNILLEKFNVPPEALIDIHHNRITAYWHLEKEIDG